MKICKVENCNNNIKYLYGKYSGYCNKHYLQLRRNGVILERTKFDKNEYIDYGDHYEIVLYDIKNIEKARTKIDKDDYEKVKNYKWCLDGRGYVVTNTDNIKLHQLILGKKDGYEIDHKFGNPLDNRKVNLRYATHQQNTFNKKSNGYTFNKKCNKWIAQIGINKKSVCLGYFKNKEDAIKARKDAELMYFGDFSYLN